MKALIAAGLVIFAAVFSPANEKTEEKEKPAQSIPELQLRIEKILKDTHTPGVSIAIVHRGGPEWVTGLGTANVASGSAATAETLFRIGSTSKAFAAMSILILADQGKLSLDDPVHKLVPEVWFENPWEATDPVRVVHLLEHTTGWDDMHFREYAKDAPGMGLREALDYDHHSRTSRWRPGTRAAYCNSGPAVAAYIVRKLTNRRFEDFVQQNLFQPIGMKTATYFRPQAGTETTLYHSDGKTPVSYWNILLRPAGSINASAQDMAAYLQFYLNRGLVNGVQVFSARDIDRMENPASTWAAKEGLRSGYGLSNYWSFHEGFAYHGHNGGVQGGLTELAYTPEYGVGYFFSINSGNGDAFGKIGKTIRQYMTLKLKKPDLPPTVPLSADAEQYAGWYEPDSPRIELTHFIERLAGLSAVSSRDGKLVISSLGSRGETFAPVTPNQFRYVPKKDDPEPAATVALLAPNDEGQFIQAGAMTTLKRIPGWFALLEIGLTAYVLLSLVAILMYGPFWVLGGLSKKRRRPAERALRACPLIAVLSFAAVIVIFMLSAEDIVSRMGNLTVWSGAFCLATIAFAAASVASSIAVARAHGARTAVRRFSGLVTAGLLIATAYLAYWGIIGLRTWA